MLTQTRADVLSQYLVDNKDKANELFELSPENALDKINADGYDYTIDELKEFINAVKLATTNGELDNEELDRVSGGVAVSVGIMIACGVGGFIAGAAASRW